MLVCIQNLEKGFDYRNKMLTSLEDLGAATFRNPSEVLQESLRSPSEVLVSFSTAVASVTHTQTNRLTFGLLGMLSQPKKFHKSQTKVQLIIV